MKVSSKVSLGVVVENAELLKARYVEKFSSGGVAGAGAIPPVPQSTTMAPAPIGVSASAANTSISAAAKPGAALAASKVPAFQLDRRFVERAPSSKPLFSTISDEYLAARRTKSGDDNADVETARFRRDLFIELIGDHPVDTYIGLHRTRIIGSRISKRCCRQVPIFLSQNVFHRCCEEIQQPAQSFYRSSGLGIDERDRRWLGLEIDQYPYQLTFADVVSCLVR